MYLYVLSRSSTLTSLGKVRLHVTLKVEESELVVLLNLEQLGQLSIRVDDSSIALILQVMCYNVGINLLAYIGSGHLCSYILSKEDGKLVTNACRLDETRWLAVATALTLLGRSLLSSLHLTRNGLLKGLKIVLKGREDTT